MLTKQNHNKGFTLVELIIVIAIIAVLAALAFMALSGETAQARDSKRVSDLKTFEDSVATANGKNKKIDYTTDTVGKDSSGAARDNTQTDNLETSSGVLQAVRGAYLVPVTNDMLDSDVLPNVANDPRGSSYFGAFLSGTDYSFYATSENPDTKIPTAIVRGTFKAGAIVDVLNANATGTGTTITVANPARFVRGDVLKIDDELLVVVERNLTTKVVTVMRGFVESGGTNGQDTTTQTVHSKGTSIKLIDPAIGGGSLVCRGTMANAANVVKVSSGTAAQTMTATVNSLTLTASSASTDAVVGSVCDSTNSSYPITDESSYLPYNVSS